MAITDHMESVALDSPITPSILPVGGIIITSKKTNPFDSARFARSLPGM